MVSTAHHNPDFCLFEMVPLASLCLLLALCFLSSPSAQWHFLIILPPKSQEPMNVFQIPVTGRYRATSLTLPLETALRMSFWQAGLDSILIYSRHCLEDPSVTDLFQGPKPWGPFFSFLLQVCFHQTTNIEVLVTLLYTHLTSRKDSPFSLGNHASQTVDSVQSAFLMQP